MIGPRMRRWSERNAMPTWRGEKGREDGVGNIPVITAATAYGITDQS